MFYSLLIAVAVLSSLVASQRSERDNTLPECVDKVADIYFLLDSSTSIYVEDYKLQLQFVSQIITRFDVSREDTRIGALTFSDDYQVGFDLDRFRTKGEMLAAVDERTLPYRTGVTNTDLAIRYVRENSAFRQDITKVIIVITDGGSRSQGATQQEAEQARDAGFHIVVVGVGQYIDEREWRAIASDPDNQHIFNITNFSYLPSLANILPQRVCSLPPIIVGGECRVRENADLLFLAAPNGVNDALDSITDLAESFRSPELLQVRYILEICEDAVDRGFRGPDQFCDRFGDAIEQNDSTYVNLLKNLRSAASSLRANRLANQVAVLFVDDQSMRSNRFGIMQESRNLALSDGLDIIVVDLGVRDYSNFVNAMTSNRDNIISYPGQGTSQSVRQILDRICASVNVPFDEFDDTRIS